MTHPHLGELFALGTAIFWTVSALAFEGATRRVGVFGVNLIRLWLAFIFLSLLGYFVRGLVLPVDATIHNWVWLGLSGVIGFILGDYFLFSSYPLIGSRMGMLLMTLAPPFAAFFGWIFLGETMSLKGLAGMVLVITGIAVTIWNKPNGQEKIRLKYPLRGLIFGLLAAMGQGGGIVLSKYGMGSYNAFAANQIRVIAGAVGFTLVVTLLGKWSHVATAIKNVPALKGITTGSFFGPFLGVSFSLLAVQNVNTGIAATIMAMVPVFIIVPSIILYKQKVNLIEILGAIVSVIGVSLFFI